MSLPALNPLAAPAVICPTCGDSVPAKPVRIGKGKVTEVTYSCINPRTNCSWEVKATLTHITGEGPYKLKEDEVKKRREVLEENQRYTDIRENSVRELIALLPHLKEVVHARRANLPAQQPTVPSPITGGAPAASTTEGSGNGNS